MPRKVDIVDHQLAREVEQFFAVTDGRARYILPTQAAAEQAWRDEGGAAGLRITTVWMTRAQFEALPEFDGF